MPPKDDDKPVELMAETETKRRAAANGKKDDKKKGGKKKYDNGGEIDDTNTMSEEDRQLKERLETCVSTLINESNEEAVTPAIRLKAIDVIVTELRSATSSMTSVPKPLKFLRPKYDVLKGYYGSIAEDKSVEGDREMVYLRARLGDVLAVLAMTLGKHGEFPHGHFIFWRVVGRERMDCADGWHRVRLPYAHIFSHHFPSSSIQTPCPENVTAITMTTTTTTTPTEERESLKFKLQGTKDYDLLVKLGDAASQDDLGSWGHEFVRSLAGEIGQEYNARVVSGADPAEDGPFADLLAMVDVIVPFNVAHNSEAEAVDLLIEVQRLKKILDIDSIDEKNYRRVCMYLIKTADFMSDPDDYTVSCPFC